MGDHIKMMELINPGCGFNALNLISTLLLLLFLKIEFDISENVQLVLYMALPTGPMPTCIHDDTESLKDSFS